MIKSRRMRWAGLIACMGEKLCAYRVSVGRPEKQRPQGEARHRWQDNIKMDYRKIGWDVMWIHLAEGRGQ
jgi:hypothetical protein